MPIAQPSKAPQAISNGKCTPTYTWAYDMAKAHANNILLHANGINKRVLKANMAMPK
jgi:hypothetical protein